MNKVTALVKIEPMFRSPCADGIETGIVHHRPQSQSTILFTQQLLHLRHDLRRLAHYLFCQFF
jgi:hypothetical protein